MVACRSAFISAQFLSLNVREPSLVSRRGMSHSGREAGFINYRELLREKKPSASIPESGAAPGQHGNRQTSNPRADLAIVIASQVSASQASLTERTIDTQQHRPEVS